MLYLGSMYVALPRAGRAVSGRRVSGLSFSRFAGIHSIQYRCLAYTPRITTHIVGRAGGLSCDVPKKLLFVCLINISSLFMAGTQMAGTLRSRQPGSLPLRSVRLGLFIGNMLSQIKPPLHLTTDQIAENLQPEEGFCFPACSCSSGLV